MAAEDAASTLLHMYKFLLSVFVPHIHFGKAEVAYCYCRLRSYSSAWCSCTLQIIYFAEISPLLSVSLAYASQ